MSIGEAIINNQMRNEVKGLKNDMNKSREKCIVEAMTIETIEWLLKVLN